MTPLQKYLSDVKARAEAATPGPWVWRKFIVKQEMTGESVSGTDNLADSEFIAHSRTDVETLVQLVEMAVKHIEPRAFLDHTDEEIEHLDAGIIIDIHAHREFLQDAAKLVEG